MWNMQNNAKKMVVFQNIQNIFKNLFSIFLFEKIVNKYGLQIFISVAFAKSKLFDVGN